LLKVPAVARLCLKDTRISIEVSVSAVSEARSL
jgi:hypothetical protein